MKLLPLILATATSVSAFPLGYMSGLGQRHVDCDSGTVYIGTMNSNRFQVIHSTPIRTIFGNPGLFSATTPNLEMTQSNNWAGQKLWLVIVSHDGRVGAFTGPDWRMPEVEPYWMLALSTETLDTAIAGRLTPGALVLENPSDATQTAIRTVTLTALQFTDLAHPELAVPVGTITLPQYTGSTNVFYRLQIQ